IHTAARARPAYSHVQPASADCYGTRSVLENHSEIFLKTAIRRQVRSWRAAAAPGGPVAISAVCLAPSWRMQHRTDEPMSRLRPSVRTLQRSTSAQAPGLLLCRVPSCSWAVHGSFCLQRATSLRGEG